jgi:hypothetical protein
MIKGKVEIPKHQPGTISLPSIHQYRNTCKGPKTRPISYRANSSSLFSTLPASQALFPCKLNRLARFLGACDWLGAGLLFRPFLVHECCTLKISLRLSLAVDLAVVVG